MATLPHGAGRPRNLSGSAAGTDCESARSKKLLVKLVKRDLESTARDAPYIKKIHALYFDSGACCVALAPALYSWVHKNAWRHPIGPTRAQQREHCELSRRWVWQFGEQVCADQQGHGTSRHVRSRSAMARNPCGVREGLTVPFDVADTLVSAHGW